MPISSLFRIQDRSDDACMVGSSENISTYTSRIADLENKLSEAEKKISAMEEKNGIQVGHIQSCF